MSEDEMKTAHKLGLASLTLAAAGSAGCSSDKAQQVARVEEPNTYYVARLAAPMTLDAHWDKPAWRKIPSIELTHFMGQRPEHFPRTQVRLAYDERFLYAIFKVDDRYV